jgi:hypothetical protein
MHIGNWNILWNQRELFDSLKVNIGKERMVEDTSSRTLLYTKTPEMRRK